MCPLLPNKPLLPSSAHSGRLEALEWALGSYSRPWQLTADRTREEDEAFWRSNRHRGEQSKNRASQTGCSAARHHWGSPSMQPARQARLELQTRGGEQRNETTHTAEIGARSRVRAC
jgi:hypothetical protein